MAYSNRYKTPSPMYQRPSPTSLERLLASWEALRKLDVEGYRTSSAHPMSTWLVDIAWSDAHSVRSPGRGTTCSPFVTQSIAMAYSPDDAMPLRPCLSTGEPLSFLFSRATNGTLSPAFATQMARHGMTMADNEWPRPIILFNMGFAIEPQQLRRGDAVHIDWMGGGGHAVFCWDVHLNQEGEVDAFQYVSSNGRIVVGGRPEGAGVGVSIGGTPTGMDGFIRQRNESPAQYEALRTPLFVDDERYVAEAAWVTWNPKLKIADLTNCKTRPRGRLSYARTVKAARLHGVIAPPPFAMRSATAVSPASPGALPVNPLRAADDMDQRTRLRLIQRQLKLLAVVGWIDADPGSADGKSGAHTLAAIRSFQQRFQLHVDGVLGPKTLAQLQVTYESACGTPLGREFLATGAESLGGADVANLAFSVPTSWGTAPILYFRHAAAARGDVIEVILESEASEGLSLPLYLRPLDEPAGGVIVTSLTCRNGIAHAAILVPPEASPARAYVAEIPSIGIETRAPLIVLDRPTAQRAQ